MNLICVISSFLCDEANSEFIYYVNATKICLLNFSSLCIAQAALNFSAFKCFARTSLLPPQLPKTRVFKVDKKENLMICVQNERKW
jgi:hypothetical protein